MSHLSVKKPLSKSAKDRLNKVSGIAIANVRYRWAIDVFERYRRKFELGKGLDYRLGLLYDHLAMQSKGKAKEHYLREARALYENILKSDPTFFHALYGIGRIYSIRGNYRKALDFQKKAYRQMMKLPKSEHGALGIGNIYRILGDLKNAERWFLKEYRDTPKDDFGTPHNLFRFYEQIGETKKALRWALVTEKLLETEYKKDVYKGLNMKQSGWVKDIKKDIEKIKNKRHG
ncbi:MAG: tetratricopeptide repeat protein [Candidatus Pacebacteria bacterium]|nr:tetratricopeptide repeat protein [Candidatus Paceibacterota bacterium]